MGNLFVKKKLVDPYIVTIDSTLLELANIGGRFFALNIYFSSDEISDDIPMSIRQLLPSQSPVHIDVMATISQSPSNL